MRNSCGAGITAILRQSKVGSVIRRMEAHPDREFFFFENIESHQNAPDHLAQHVWPSLTHVGKLSFERIRRCQCGRAQQINKVLICRTEARASLEIFLQVRGDLRISRVLLELRIVEQFFEAMERRIGICQPEHHQFFESDCATRRIPARSV